MALVVYDAVSKVDTKTLAERVVKVGPDTVVLQQHWSAENGRGGTGGAEPDAELGFGGVVRDAAVVLAAYLRPRTTGLRCIELGCGPGLGAIACALGGASESVATDGDRDVIDGLCKPNLARCAAPAKARADVLLWGDDAAADALGPPFDLCHVADCAAFVYRAAWPALQASMRRLSSRVWMSYTRRDASEDGFFAALAEQGWTRERVAQDALLADFDPRRSDPKARVSGGPSDMATGDIAVFLFTREPEAEGHVT